jgi:hypothetical protein
LRSRHQVTNQLADTAPHHASPVGGLGHRIAVSRMLASGRATITRLLSKKENVGWRPGETPLANVLGDGFRISGVQRAPETRNRSPRAQITAR